MQVVESKQNITRVKPGSIFLKSSNLGQVEEEFSSGAVFQDEEQFAVVLEGIVHPDHKGVLDIFEDSPLSHGVLHLVALYNFCLF